MQGGKSKQPLGYSVIETMIFMAVSGLMFIIAAVFVSGKAANVEYRQSMSDTEVQLRSIVNEVSNGEYESIGSRRCVATDAGGPPTFLPFLGTGQGTNGGRSAGLAGCIFMGKVIHFGVDNDPNQYAIYSVVGRQTKPSSEDTVKNFNDAQPIVVDTGLVDLTLIKTLQKGLTFTSAWVCTIDCVTGSPAATSTGVFGFFGSFGGYVGSANNNESGSQRIFTTIVPGTGFPIGNPGNNRTAMAGSLNFRLPNLDTPATNFITNGRLIMLCFEYNTEKGSIAIGGSNGQSFTTDVQLGQRTSGIC